MTHKALEKNYLHFGNWEKVNARNEADLYLAMLVHKGELLHDKTDARFIWFDDIFEGVALNFEPNFECEKVSDWGICHLDWNAQGVDTNGIIKDNEVVKTIKFAHLYGDLQAQKELIIGEVIAEIRRIFTLLNQ